MDKVFYEDYKAQGHLASLILQFDHLSVIGRKQYSFVLLGHYLLVSSSLASTSQSLFVTTGVAGDNEVSSIISYHKFWNIFEP